MDTTTWDERRQRAVERLLQGETFTGICRVERGSRSWVSKWGVRHPRDTATWVPGDSRRPPTQPGRTPAESAESVPLVRREWYHQAQGCGAQAIRWRPAALAVPPLATLPTVGRLRARRALMHCRTGRSGPTGVPSPRRDAVRAPEVPQRDCVGPGTLRGGLWSPRLPSRDGTTRRGGVDPLIGDVGSKAHNRGRRCKRALTSGGRRRSLPHAPRPASLPPDAPGALHHVRPGRNASNLATFHQVNGIHGHLVRFFPSDSVPSGSSVSKRPA